MTSTSPLKIFLDADPLVYGIGFAAQSTFYEVVWEEAGQLKEQAWEDGNEKLNYFRALKKDGVEYEILEDTAITEAEPVEHALSMIKVTIKSIQREIAEHYKRDVFDTHLILLLTGNDTYRKTLAKQKAYKGNRKAAKPVHYAALRQYAVEAWNAQVVDVLEADDECSIQARDTGGVVATIDKDLDQIPGHHYDYKKKVFYEVDPYDAMLFFYQQAISGDATDNVPGAWKIGSKKAEALVKDRAAKIYYEWHEDPEDFEKRLWETVIQAYKSTLGMKGCPYTRDQVQDVALETARLVKMLEYEDQMWNPSGTEDGSIQEYMNNVNRN